MGLYEERSVVWSRYYVYKDFSEKPKLAMGHELIEMKHLYGNQDLGHTSVGLEVSPFFAKSLGVM